MANLTALPNTITSSSSPALHPTEYAMFPSHPTILEGIVAFCHFTAIAMGGVLIMMALLVKFIPDDQGLPPRKAIDRSQAKTWALCGLPVIAVPFLVSFVAPTGSFLWAATGLAAAVVGVGSCVMLLRETIRMDNEWVVQQRCRGCGKRGWERVVFCGECGVAGPFVKEEEAGCKGCGNKEEIQTKFCQRCGTASGEGGREDLKDAEEGKTLIDGGGRWGGEERAVDR